MALEAPSGLPSSSSGKGTTGTGSPLSSLTVRPPVPPEAFSRVPLYFTTMNGAQWWELDKITNEKHYVTEVRLSTPVMVDQAISLMEMVTGGMKFIEEFVPAHGSPEALPSAFFDPSVRLLALYFHGYIKTPSSIPYDTFSVLVSPEGQYIPVFHRWGTVPKRYGVLVRSLAKATEAIYVADSRNKPTRTRLTENFTLVFPRPDPKPNSKRRFIPLFEIDSDGNVTEVPPGNREAAFFPFTT